MPRSMAILQARSVGPRWTCTSSGGTSANLMVLFSLAADGLRQI